MGGEKSVAEGQIYSLFTEFQECFLKSPLAPTHTVARKRKRRSLRCGVQVQAICICPALAV